MCPLLQGLKFRLSWIDNRNLRQTVFQNSTGNTLFWADFDFGPYIVPWGRKSKNASKSMFPFEFGGGVWRNRFVRALGVQQFWEHNSKKFRKLFLRSQILPTITHDVRRIIQSFGTKWVSRFLTEIFFKLKIITRIEFVSLRAFEPY